MKLFIPSIGDKIELTRKWEFPLYMEHRNQSLWQRLRPGEFKWTYGPFWPLGGTKHLPSTIAVLEKGTILTVSRIYIRQGASAFDSVTFRIAYAPKDPNRIKPDPNAAEGSPEQKYKGCRFWAKLDDVNTIHCKLVEG